MRDADAEARLMIFLNAPATPSPVTRGEDQTEGAETAVSRGRSSRSMWGWRWGWGVGGGMWGWGAAAGEGEAGRGVNDAVKSGGVGGRTLEVLILFYFLLFFTKRGVLVGGRWRYSFYCFFHFTFFF